MPNWCANRLTITGPKSERERFAAFGASSAMRSAEEDHEPARLLSFTEFLPEPDALDGIHSGMATIDGKRYNTWREVDDGGKKKDIGITTAEEKRLCLMYGASNLYDWHVSNWGTKWDCSDVALDRKKTSLVYRFQTAWSPPNDNLMLKMTELFPELTFKLEFAEIGAGYIGRTIYHNNEGQEQLSRDIETYDFDDRDNWCGPSDFRELVSHSG